MRAEQFYDLPRTFWGEEEDVSYITGMKEWYVSGMWLKRNWQSNSYRRDEPVLVTLEERWMSGIDGEG